LNGGANFGTGGEGMLRLNFASPPSMLEDGLERIRGALERMKG
jgi:cystathionine beta-lyase